jgi:hypothetical protein
MADIDTFVKVYSQALRDENAAVFAGAGLSIPTGLVDWTALMRDIAQDVGLNVDSEHDLLSVAQFHVNERGGRHRINQALVTEFAERSTLSENHRILASLPIKTFWTTNYDTLIEESLRQARKRVDVKTTEQSLAVTLPRRDAVLYKMHGDVASVDQAVVTKDDYEAYSTTHALFGTALQGDLVSKTFLFIGFSFNDPNLTYLLSRIRILLGQQRREHYALLRRVHLDDFKSQSEFDYARSRQDLQVRDLRRYGIQGLLVDSYGDYTSVLKRIADTFRRRRVFVSGSAATYGPFSEHDGQEFLRRLGASLVESDFDVVTGFGLGVGPFLLNGALEGLEKSGTRSLHDRVTLRPFPQGIPDAAARAARWREYRREMIAMTGIAIIVFGNRRNQDGHIESAAGVQEEFDLAVQLGVGVVPIGATESKARELHGFVMSRFDGLHSDRADLRQQFARLGDQTDPETLVNRTIAIVTSLARGV